MEEDKKNQEEESSENKSLKDKKIKNLVSVIIVLAGLFVASVFVDVAQMVRGSGFSSKKLSQIDIFENNDKTWVAYSEPMVKVQVFTDDTCDACRPDEALLWLKRIVPTILTSKIDVNSAEGEKLVKDLNIKTVPAFVFSKEVEKTDFYAQAAMLFNQKGSQYVLKTAEVGLPIGRYLELPQIAEDDPQVGPQDAKVRIVEYSDFQCPYCRSYHLDTTEKILKEYGNKVLFAYKYLPLEFHAQAENAALSAQCANEQGKFFPYADKLFQSQSDWGSATDTQKFKLYAQQLGLKTAQFNECLDSKKYQDKVNQDKEEAASFGISGTPATFVNSQFQNGMLGYTDLKKIIDQELAK